MDWTLWIIIGAVIAGVFILKRMSFVSLDTARSLLKAGALVIDVRSVGEFNAKHLPGAINIELGNIGAEIGRLAPDKEQVILLHCLSGGRSGFARQQLRRMGYKSVHNLGSYGRAEKIVRAANT
jgi:phage shock protein E